MPSRARSTRRVRSTRGNILMETLTPHTLASHESYLFVMSRNATDNFILRIPMKAVLSILGLPKNHAITAQVLDIDPDTTEFTYSGRYPKFVAHGEDEDAERSPED